MQKFACEINKLSAVTEYHLVGGDFDMLAKVQVADMAAYRYVLSHDEQASANSRITSGAKSMCKENYVELVLTDGVTYYWRLNPDWNREEK